MAWQPIETAPKDGQTILVAAPGGPVAEVKWEPMRRVPSRWRTKGYALPWSPTHWQPMPTPPPYTEV